MNKHKIGTTKGFTLIELLVAILLASLLFVLSYRFMSGTREHYQHGTVNLQNLHEAQMAINYIRRDVSSAAPFIGQGASIEAIQRARACLFQTPDWQADTPQIRLIQLLSLGDSSSLSIPRFVYESAPAEPQLETVTYTHDEQTLALTRQVINKKGEVINTKKFSGILKVNFRFYVHASNNKAPLLWVSLLVHEGLTGHKEYGAPLALTASIASPAAASLAKHRAWRFETTGSMR